MRSRESQTGSISETSRGFETIREQYGPDWFRDIAEPMVCEYLERQFPDFERVFWASEIPEGDRLDRKGVDGVIVLQKPEEGPHSFLGIQISTASLTERHGREVWAEKFRTWKKNPVHTINGEAPYIRAEEGDPLPIVFVRMNRADLETAWESTTRGDWRGEQSVNNAREAARKLPVNPRFQKDILDAMWLSLETLTQTRPELSPVLSRHRDILSRERERITREIQNESRRA